MTGFLLYLLAVRGGERGNYIVDGLNVTNLS